MIIFVDSIIIFFFFFNKANVELTTLRPVIFQMRNEIFKWFYLNCCSIFKSRQNSKVFCEKKQFVFNPSRILLNSIQNNNVIFLFFYLGRIKNEIKIL